MKTCNKCGVEKALDMFYKNSAGKYGVRADCKECHNKYRREYGKEYHQRPEVKKRKKEYSQRPEVKERRNEYKKEWHIKNKEQRKIRGSGRRRAGAAH